MPSVNPEYVPLVYVASSLRGLAWIINFYKINFYEQFRCAVDAKNYVLDGILNADFDLRRYYIYTAKSLNDEEAHIIELVDQFTPSKEELMERALELSNG